MCRTPFLVGRTGQALDSAVGCYRLSIYQKSNKNGPRKVCRLCVIANVLLYIYESVSLPLLPCDRSLHPCVVSACNMLLWFQTPVWYLRLLKPSRRLGSGDGTPGSPSLWTSGCLLSIPPLVLHLCVSAPACFLRWLSPWGLLSACVHVTSRLATAAYSCMLWGLSVEQSPHSHPPPTTRHLIRSHHGSLSIFFIDVPAQCDPKFPDV